MSDPVVPFLTLGHPAYISNNPATSPTVNGFQTLYEPWRDQSLKARGLHLPLFNTVHQEPLTQLLITSGTGPDRKAITGIPGQRFHDDKTKGFGPIDGKKKRQRLAEKARLLMLADFTDVLTLG